MEKKKIQVVDLYIKKDGTDVFLELKTDPALEDFFKAMSGEKVNQSSRWFDTDNKGLMFYSRTDAVLRFREEITKAGIFCFDDFGDGLLRNSTKDPNIALLRIVGASGGVKIRLTDIISMEDAHTYTRRLSDVIKQIYQKYITKCEAKASITISYEN